MIEVSPAILTNDEKELHSLWLRYVEWEVNQIDVDIVGEGFSGDATLSLSQVMGILPSLLSSNYGPSKLGLHLMTTQPLELVTQHLELMSNKDLLLYVHNSNDIPPLLEYGLSLAYVYNPQDQILQLPDFLDKCVEVQFMTVSPGRQGGQFLPGVGAQVTKLRQLGYTGRVALDGGVNMTTAQVVRGWSVDRVSVGSFLQKSTDPKADYLKLKKFLNE